jgi:hypothetical protein
LLLSGEKDTCLLQNRKACSALNQVFLFNFEYLNITKPTGTQIGKDWDVVPERLGMIRDWRGKGRPPGEGGGIT